MTDLVGLHRDGDVAAITIDNPPVEPSTWMCGPARGPLLLQRKVTRPSP
ncbi:hypothetical protein [Rhodoplanes sp.]|nr:hypothetical protein [Rhodoplanes sp.]